MAGKSKLYDVPSAAEYIGVADKTVRGWIYARKITFVKVGRLVRIQQEVLDEIIDRGTMPALRQRHS